MGVIGHILAGLGLVFLGFGIAIGVVLYWMMKLDAGQMALAAQVALDKAATLQTTLEMEVIDLRRKVAELMDKVAALWKRDG